MGINVKVNKECEMVLLNWKNILRNMKWIKMEIGYFYGFWECLKYKRVLYKKVRIQSFNNLYICISEYTKDLMRILGKAFDFWENQYWVLESLFGELSILG